MTGLLGRRNRKDFLPAVSCRCSPKLFEDVHVSSLPEGRQALETEVVFMENVSGLMVRSRVTYHFLLEETVGKMKFQNLQVFDHILSLGVNCENTFVIQELFGKVDSTLFTWAFIEDPFRLLEYIDNPDILFADGMTITPSKMFRCESTNFLFHSAMQKKDRIFDADDELRGDTLKEAEAEVRSRVRHLADKFWDRINSEDRNLFVMKLFSNEGQKHHIAGLLAKLTDLLDKKCSNKNFMLMCVLEQDYAQSIEREITDKRLVIKRIRKFAHWASTDKFDKEAWEKIYNDIRIKTT